MFFRKDKKKKIAAKADAAKTLPAGSGEIDYLTLTLHIATMRIWRSFASEYEQIVVSNAQIIPNYATNRDKLLEADGGYFFMFFGGLIIFNAEVAGLFDSSERALVIENFVDAFGRELAYRTPGGADPALSRVPRVQAVTASRDGCADIFLETNASEASGDAGRRVMDWSMMSFMKIYPSALSVVMGPGGPGLTSQFWMAVIMAFNRHLTAGEHFIATAMSPPGSE